MNCLNYVLQQSKKTGRPDVFVWPYFCQRRQALYGSYCSVDDFIYRYSFASCDLVYRPAVLVLLYLWSSIPADFSTVWQALDHPPEHAASKLTLIDTSWDFSSASAFTIYSSVTVFFFFFFS